jgi:hypothetical protein
LLAWQSKSISTWLAFRVDPEWKEFDHETESIQDRLEHIYMMIGKPISFESGIWSDVMGLFEMEKKIKGYSSEAWSVITRRKSLK